MVEWLRSVALRTLRDVALNTLWDVGLSRYLSVLRRVGELGLIVASSRSFDLDGGDACEWQESEVSTSSSSYSVNGNHPGEPPS